MREILHELRATGPTALDVTDAQERHTAVARTIGVSLSRLTPEQRDRYLELAVFGEDVAIPGPVLARYWKATGGWSDSRPGGSASAWLSWLWSATTGRIPTRWYCMTSSAATCANRPSTGAASWTGR